MFLQPHLFHCFCDLLLSLLQLLLNGLQCWHAPGIIRAVTHLQLHRGQLAAHRNRWQVDKEQEQRS
jgi:hypothetical protein